MRSVFRAEISEAYRTPMQKLVLVTMYIQIATITRMIPIKLPFTRFGTSKLSSQDVKASRLEFMTTILHSEMISSEKL
jgi:hypothetical protein